MWPTERASRQGLIDFLVAAILFLPAVLLLREAGLRYLDQAASLPPSVSPCSAPPDVESTRDCWPLRQSRCWFRRWPRTCCRPCGLPGSPADCSPDGSWRGS